MFKVQGEKHDQQKEIVQEDIKTGEKRSQEANDAM